MKRTGLYSCFIILFALITACSMNGENNAIPEEELGRIQHLANNDPQDEQIKEVDELPDLLAHFIDAGQGEAVLLETEEFNILIDAGRHDDTAVIDFLHDRDIEELDLFIGSNVHDDHIGQLPEILEELIVHEVWMNGDAETTETFERALDAIQSSGAVYHEPKAGDSTLLERGQLSVLHPEQLGEHKSNNSLVVKFNYGDVSMLFTGDLDEDAEGELVSREMDLSSHILKVADHGSNRSSSESFLQEVQPEIAIYSAGEGNSHGHPHEEALQRLTATGADVYGTDTDGVVTVYTNGRDYVVRTGDGAKGPESLCEAGQVAVNNANAKELQEISHIGPERAEQMIDLRPFSSYNDLMQIEGIGERRLEQIESENSVCFIE
ncbi:late competence protein ComEC, DNA transport [Geomicrobium sp. JCM 19037]|uniref:MBL fold metallo-hydrolase n=1 Tax=Geomicrobium sp. JCM 19037 TaxID=1460634 RepID=UPI00045F28E8|nr:MBL fold metallo-hydrolase [Geomicrobium sp. JCM 19037]GAK06054.1 late competence protein ComEC, DNA transport [Geomicrobium sp. JCM 19037]